MKFQTMEWEFIMDLFLISMSIQVCFFAEWLKNIKFLFMIYKFAKLERKAGNLHYLTIDKSCVSRYVSKTFSYIVISFKNKIVKCWENFMYSKNNVCLFPLLLLLWQFLPLLFPLPSKVDSNLMWYLISLIVKLV